MYALSGVCPPCSFHNGINCVPCPEGSDYSECAGCVEGELPAAEESWWDRSKFWAPMVVTVAGAVLSTIAVAIVVQRMNIKE